MHLMFGIRFGRILHGNLDADSALCVSMYLSGPLATRGSALRCCAEIITHGLPSFIALYSCSLWLILDAVSKGADYRSSYGGCPAALDLFNFCSDSVIIHSLHFTCFRVKLFPCAIHACFIGDCMKSMRQQCLVADISPVMERSFSATVFSNFRLTRSCNACSLAS